MVTRFKETLLRKSSETDYSYSGFLNDQIRLAIFVPFLEDKRYANSDGLPDDRHECNYQSDRALVWQELPYQLKVSYKKDRETNERQYRIEIDGIQRKASNR